MQLSKRWWLIFDRILGLFAILAGVLIIAAMLLTVYEVVLRYVFNIGGGWVTETINAVLLFITFLGTAWVLKEKGHIAMDLVYSRLNQKTKLFFNLFFAVVGIAVCLTMMLSSAETAVDYLMRGIREDTTLRAPRGLIIGIIPVGFFLLLIEFARQFFRHLTLLRKDK